MRQAQARQQVRQEGADVVARCEGAEYLVFGVTERGAAFVKGAPAVIPRRDGGLVASPDNVRQMVRMLAAVGLIVRRIEQ